MSGVRQRAERRAGLACDQAAKPHERQARALRGGMIPQGGSIAFARTRDKVHLPADLPQPQEYSVPWAPNFKMSREEYDRAMAAEAERQGQRGQREVRERQQEALRLAGEQFETETRNREIVDILAGFTLQEAELIHEIVRCRFPDNTEDPTAYRLAAGELRELQRIESEARTKISKMLISTIEAADEEQLATYLGCDATTAARLRKEV